MSNNNINIKIKAQNEASSALSQAEKELNNLKSSADNSTSAFNSFGNSFSSMCSTVAAGAASFVAAQVTLNAFIGTVKAAKEAFFDYNAQIEQYKIAFTNLTGSTEAGLQHMKELRDFAEKTPFDTIGIYKMSQELQGFGFELDTILPLLDTFGNVAARGGKSSEQMAEALRQFSQARAKGHFDMQDINSFASNLGINAKQLIMDELGISFDDINKTAFDDIAPLLLNRLQNMSKGMLQEQNKTATGMINNIKESLSNAFAELGEPLFDWCKVQLTALVQFADDFKDLVQGRINLHDILSQYLSDDAADFITHFVDVASEAFNSLYSIFKKVIDIINKIFEAFGVYDMLEYNFKSLAFAVEVCLEAFAGFLDQIEKEITAIDEFITPVLIELKTSIEELFDGLYSLIVSFYDWCTDIFQEARATWNDIMGSCCDGLLSTIANFVSNVIPILQPVIRALNFIDTKLNHSGGGGSFIDSSDDSKEQKEIDWNKIWHRGTASSSSSDKGSSSSAANKEAREAERMADKIQKSWERLMDRISDACDTTYARGMKRLQKEIEEYKQQILEAAEYGIDTSAMEMALEDYAIIMKEKLQEAAKDAYVELDVKVKRLKGDLTENVSLKLSARKEELEYQLEKDLRELRKKTLTGDPEIDKNTNILFNDLELAQRLSNIYSILNDSVKEYAKNREGRIDYLNSLAQLGETDRTEIEFKKITLFGDEIEKLKNEYNNAIEDLDLVMQKYTESAIMAGVPFEEIQAKILEMSNNFVVNTRETLTNINLLQSALNRAKANFDISIAFSEGWKDVINNFKTDGELICDMCHDIADNIADTFSELFENLVDGELKSFKDYFVSFAKSITHAIAQMYAQAAAQSLIKWVFGGRATGGYVPAYATGTGNASNTFIAGEHGPELINLHGGSASVISTHTTQRQLNNTPDVIININNQSGQQMQAKQTGSRFEADKYIIDVIMTAVANNTSGMRTMLAGV